MTGKLYAVDGSTNLMGLPPFLNLASNIVGQINCTTYTDTNNTSVSRAYYRIRVQ